MRLIILIVLFFLTFFSNLVNAQYTTRKIINIPDIPGYRTLKCDFHMHTVFSDGVVWPTFRVEEAWSEGLDVIAITDHLGQSPYNKVSPTTLNQSYDIAKPIADRLGIVLIRGTEITQKMPPGHFDVLFLKDINPLESEDYMNSFKAAADQGAFIFWNHPGWKQPDDIPVWYDIHSEIFNKGWMNGIEIVNNNYYYPLAFKWAIEKNLTIFANSDIHDPATAEFDYTGEQHRPMTLVFSVDTSQNAIKDALLKHRTIVYNKDELIGNEEYLKSIFFASVNIINSEIEIEANSRDNYYNYIKIKNNSCINYKFKLAEKNNEIRIPQDIILKANTITLLKIRAIPKDITGEKEYKLKYSVTNLLKSATENVVVEIPIKVKFIKN